MQFIFNNNEEIENIETKKCVFVDGTSTLIDINKDLELSHWIPNNTQDIYKAATSTQICFNYVKLNDLSNYDCVINNHVDVDGILSAFVIMFSKVSLKYEAIISGASMMGDFSAYGPYDVSHFYIHLGEEIKKYQSLKIDSQQIFEKCFLFIKDYFLDKKYVYDEYAKKSIDELENSLNLVKNNKIQRVLQNDLFSSYFIPFELTKLYDKSPIYKAGFDFGLDIKQLLPMQILNYFDFERQKLLIVENEEGSYFYDCLLPDYLWAETSALYRTKGVSSTDSTNVHLFENSKLLEAQKLLQKAEKNQGLWELATTFHPFSSIKGRGFPVVLSFMNEGKVAPSSNKPNFVIGLLEGVWA
ncbi:MAG: hypothetical protein COB02_11690 [Candidatus Cloacimonadota bacterium]|nr:MAG: hypothetical protein COB02_11690 [Candidatus Cloacimonadota bacterium]